METSSRHLRRPGSVIACAIGLGFAGGLLMASVGGMELAAKAGGTPPAEHLAPQSPPAGGPWSGGAQCVVVGKWTDYYEEQTQTWNLSGGPPTPTPSGSAQVYYTWPATWTVQGSGRKAPSSRPPGDTKPGEAEERWTIATEMNLSLRITELGNGRIRITTDGQRGGPLGSIRVTEVSGRTREASVQPWSFPAIEDVVTATTISGSDSRTYPEGVGIGWAYPPKAVTTATCTWKFTRGASPGLPTLPGTPPQPATPGLPAGIANWERVAATSPAIGGVLSQNRSFVVTATCPAGKKVVGGGTSLAGAAAYIGAAYSGGPVNWADTQQIFKLVESYPESNGGGWTARWTIWAQTNSLPAGMLQVFAICVTG